MEVRRDNKGRILRIGEIQRQDGRYAYTIQDNGRRKTLYSWTLTESDRTPSGKKTGPSLRTQIREYEEKQKQGIVNGAESITVKELIEMFIDLKKPLVRASTLRNYHSERNRIANTSIYFERITKLNYLQCKMWVLELKETGIKNDTIGKTHALLKQALDIAVENGWLAKNPAEFKLTKVIGKMDQEIRYPLTDEWQKKVPGICCDFKYLFLLLRCNICFDEYRT